MIQVDENVKVLTNQAGEPIRFSWRNGNYKVTSRPERWYSRRPWWLEARRAQRGIGSGVLEVEMWRLSAVKGVSSPSEFELLHSQADDGWQLVRVCG
ncbi:unannotated protein [freshwater metagenome]|uniref:Unannotated protein n=1 Tax=freshwater metagenome TaxID=449393 RepID=A0A6J6IMP6_9ZZZZ